MRRITSALVYVVMAIAAPAVAQGTGAAHDNHVILQGCVAEAGPRDVRPRSLLVWTRGDIVLQRARAISGFPVASVNEEPMPFVYWLEDEESLAQYVGQYVEAEGELTDIAEADVQLRQVTEISLNLDGVEGIAYVPSAWLRPSEAPPVVEYDLPVRRIDVESVDVLRACELS